MPPRAFPLVRLAVAGSVLAARTGWAQGRTAAPILTLPASARAAALGDAYGASHPAAGDPASMFYNPAQLAGMPGTAAALSVERYLASSTLVALAAARRVGRVAVGAGAVALDYPETAEIVPDAGGTGGTETGARIGASELAPMLAIATGGPRARVGFATRYVSQTLPGAGTRGGITVDAGAAGEIAHGEWGRLDVSAAIQHAGRALETGTVSAPLPRTWRVGAGLAEHALARGRWSVLGELVGTRDARLAGRGGVEGAWRFGRTELAARGGWAAQPAGALASPLAVGAGLRRERLWLDYAWRRFGVLGSTHRVGVRWHR